jgi:hypothetical protein
MSIGVLNEKQSNPPRCWTTLAKRVCYLQTTGFFRNSYSRILWHIVVMLGHGLFPRHLTLGAGY